MNIFWKRPHQQVIDLLPAILLLVIGLLALAYAMLQPTGTTKQFGVFLNPWADVSEAVNLLNQAQAQILSFSERTNIAVVYAERMDAVEALYAAGAWFVFEPAQSLTCFDVKRAEI